MTPGRRMLACLTAAAAVSGAAGCGGSAAPRSEAVAETYLERRLERQQGSRASADVVVLCRPASGERHLCGTLVTDDIVGTSAVRQRWAVTLDRGERVTGARLLSSREDAPGVPLPEVRYVFAKDAAMKATAARRRAASKRRRERAAAARARVHLLIVPRQPVYVCIVDGGGRRRFDRIATSPVRARGRRLTVTLGSRAARVTVDGRPVAIPSSPYAFVVRPGVRRSVPLTARPCF